jgi:hypothetical protein
MRTQPLLKIEFYVPESHLEVVKSAMFGAGAGRVGEYECCAWQTAGQGQFRPLPGSTPYLGTQDKLETVPEYKVEMVCLAELAEPVVAALKAAHPYDEVAYSVLRMEALA